MERANEKVIDQTELADEDLEKAAGGWRIARWFYKQGSGKRRLAVFGDPNCGYCKRLERDLVALKDVTIYTVVYPVLGPDSLDKPRAIVCAPNPAIASRA